MRTLEMRRYLLQDPEVGLTWAQKTEMLPPFYVDVVGKHGSQSYLKAIRLALKNQGTKGFVFEQVLASKLEAMPFDYLLVTIERGSKQSELIDEDPEWVSLYYKHGANAYLQERNTQSVRELRKLRDSILKLKNGFNSPREYVSKSVLDQARGVSNPLAEMLECFFSEYGWYPTLEEDHQKSWSGTTRQLAFKAYELYRKGRGRTTLKGACQSIIREHPFANGKSVNFNSLYTEAKGYNSLGPKKKKTLPLNKEIRR